jgi:uncharacterized protein (DUF1810 family)
MASIFLSFIFDDSFARNGVLCEQSLKSQRAASRKRGGGAQTSKEDRLVAQNSDPFDLDRFLMAQAPVIDLARAELKAGRKRSHWMWFVFPQIEGLGLSVTAERYAIRSLAEAKAYLRHPILGRRLRDCARLVCETRARPLEEIFGYPDWLKFRSSMTLFSAAAPDEAVFAEALEKFCKGERDPLTLEKLSAQEEG